MLLWTVRGYDAPVNVQGQALAPYLRYYRRRGTPVVIHILQYRDLRQHVVAKGDRGITGIVQLPIYTHLESDSRRSGIE